jgi:hypothetical protein
VTPPPYDSKGEFARRGDEIYERDVPPRTIIRLAARGPEGQEQKVKAVIDMGSDGTFTLPPVLIAAHSLV